jgi:hypothetical protein
MIIPAWFEKELKMIDHLYFPEWNAQYEYWEIKRKMTEHFTSAKHGIAIKFHNPTVGVYTHLNDATLENLRERKWLSRRYPGQSYVTWLINQAKDAKDKKEQLAVEMATEGMMRIFNQGKSKVFDMATEKQGG